jgi:hypothetical protein
MVRLKRNLLVYFDEYERDEAVSMGLDKRAEFRVLLEQFGVLTQNHTYADATFRLLNSGKLTRRLLEQTLTSITKFIR